MSEISLPISIGEGIDKLTILEIKYKFINNKLKQNEVKKELDAINIILKNYKDKIQFYYKCLYDSNKIIWDMCDKIRDKENNTNYAKLCVDIIEENDNRFRIKNKINMLFNSNLKEQKSYVPKKIMFNVSLGPNDIIMIYGHIRYYSIKYDEIIVRCNHDCYNMTKSAFDDDKTIKIIEDNIIMEDYETVFINDTNKKLFQNFNYFPYKSG